MSINDPTSHREPKSEASSKFAWFLVDRQEPPKRSATERIADFLEITSGLDEVTAREQAGRCIQCPEPMCRRGCPLANRIPEWIALTAEGHFLEAAEICNQVSNMPEVCARICPQERLCEGSCILNGKSEPVSIGALERFVTEYAFTHGGLNVTQVTPNGFRAAVIGSGPGGLACADELAKLGYTVTIFESQQLPGGLLVNGIPAFKLDKTVVGRRTEVLKQRGVEFRVGVRVGRDLTLSELMERYDAVFLAFGALQARPLHLPGDGLKQVFQGLPFLVQKNVPGSLGCPAIDVQGKRVLVLGGGDTAMDCLRTAIRCGAKEAICLYRRDLANMPGSRKEYVAALEEGACFSFLTNPIAVLGDADGNVIAVRATRMALGEPDATGRRKPTTMPNSEFDQPADVVLVAYGFDPVPLPADSDLGRIKANSWGGVIVDDNQMTSLPGVFAGGDLVRGPSLVVHAVRDGRRAARCIQTYLAGQTPKHPVRVEAVPETRRC
ncbi:MAG: NAD(P)-dependent oxidoreductase [Verrucomicrobiota bacterium]